MLFSIGTETRSVHIDVSINPFLIKYLLSLFVNKGLHSGKAFNKFFLWKFVFYSNSKYFDNLVFSKFLFLVIYYQQYSM